jgi:micrococcal nuclease|tara:strand:- start:2948 stop:3379 length:432 start_codon:yes stop_codon:yes gene_type:complete
MFEYEAKVKRVVDGDTIDAYIDLGFNVHVDKRIRFMGIDTPESRTRDLTEKRYGLGAKYRLIEMLEANGNVFVLKSHGTGKFGRVLGELFHHHEDDYSINQMLIDEGHAVAYFGGSKQEVKDALMEARKLSTEYVEKHIEALD